MQFARPHLYVQFFFVLKESLCTKLSMDIWFTHGSFVDSQVHNSPVNKSKKSVKKRILSKIYATFTKCLKNELGKKWKILKTEKKDTHNIQVRLSSIFCHNLQNVSQI